MAERIEAHDWAATPLGPQAGWPQSLSTLVSLMLHAPQPATLAVGPERVLLYNDEAAKHYGARHPDVLGLPLRHAFAHEFHRVAPLYDRAFAGESIHAPAERLDPGLTGTPEVFDAFLTPVFDDGRVIAVYMTGLAVASRLRAEAALRESEARLAAAFESVPVGVAVLDMAGRIAIANTEYRRFLPGSVIPSRDPEGGWRWRAWHGDGRPLDPQEFPGARALRGDRVVPGQEMLYTDDTGREIWTRVASVPIRDADGRMTAQASVISDIDALKRNAMALHDSEERLRQFGDASGDILWLRDAATLQWVYLTPAFEAIYGLSRDEALAGDNYRSWRELIVPEDRDHATAAVARVRAGERVTFEYRVRRPIDGAVRWLRSTDFPITDERGEVVLIGGIGHDLTDEREAELRFRTLVEGIPQLVWRAVDVGEWTWANPQWTACTDQQAADYAGWGWLAALHPDDREAAREAWAHAAENGGFEVEYRIKRQRDGLFRWFQTRAAPVRDGAGNIVEWLGTSTDIHELRESQELQKTLLAELQHRVRNILAVTRSIVSRSDDGERQTQDYVQHLQGRISALARTQVLLTRKAGAGIDLEELIRDELLAQVASEEQFTLRGSAVELSPKAAEVLTLAIHELATNANKYGAFTRAGGHLHVGWSVEQREDQRWVVLDWIESGVPIVDAAPRRRGFGAELVSRRIPYELKGHGQFELAPGGLKSHIEFPLVAGDSILRTDGAER